MRLNAGVRRGEAVTLVVNGEPVPAFQGETVAAALWASGIRVFRRTARESAPRGLFCVMGVCFDCVVSVDGRRLRACLTRVQDGMSVQTTAS